MRKPNQAILYLVVCTLAIFYGQRLLNSFGGSGGDDPRARAEDAHMDEDAYYSLREVAGIQLGHISVTYRVDEASGRCLARFRNDACLNLQADPDQLKKQIEDQQDELHERILLLGPGADVDKSGFVTTEEGARFRDLFAFAHLAAHGDGGDAVEANDLARATGLEAEEAARNLQDYRMLVAGYPAEVRKFFPAVHD